MPRPKKKGSRSGKVKKAIAKKVKKVVKEKPRILSLEEEKYQNEQNDNLKCIKLIRIIRNSKDKEKTDVAFFKVFESLRPQMQYIVNRFTIPGLNNEDIMQEALYALRYKAIKDYDQKRGRGDEPASFKLFALLCIRRHLTTERKSSLFNNRKKILNQSMSLDQEHRSSDEDLSLINIIPSSQDNILDALQKNESYKNLMTSLIKKLSRFEREVLSLYAQSFSYEEIAEKINEKRVKIKVDVKGVDNALSRIKHKARSVLNEIENASKDKDN
jgi:RNA polymerase sporulation-specific sigma factor